MRVWMWCTAAILVAQHGQALAADQLQFGPAPAWVVPVESPAPPAATDDASSFTILLDNEQAMLEKGKRSYFGESIYRINSPQGLDDGNVTLTWDPTTDSVVVHKLLLRRGKEVIDVLKSGQKFTTIRRETNLEAGMLDGRLTATLLPKGCRSAISSSWRRLTSTPTPSPRIRSRSSLQRSTATRLPVATRACPGPRRCRLASRRLAGSRRPRLRRRTACPSSNMTCATSSLWSCPRHRRPASGPSARSTPARLRVGAKSQL